MRQTLIKTVFLCGLAAFAFGAAAPAKAVVYIKKNDTKETAPVQSVPKETPKKPLVQVPPEPAVQATPQIAPQTVESYAAMAGAQSFIINPANGPCTQEDIKSLQSIQAAQQVQKNIDTASKITGKEMEKDSVALDKLAGFYTTPGNMEKMVMMTLRCSNVDISQAAQKKTSTKKK